MLTEIGPGEKCRKGSAVGRLPGTVAPSTASPLVGPLACLRLSWEWRKYTCLDSDLDRPRALCNLQGECRGCFSDALVKGLVSAKRAVFYGNSVANKSREPDGCCESGYRRAYDQCDANQLADDSDVVRMSKPGVRTARDEMRARRDEHPKRPSRPE